MVENLKGFRIRDIFIKQEVSFDNYKRLGKKIFYLLKEIRYRNQVKGCYFTHYFDSLKKIEPQYKVGIRFDKKEDLMAVNDTLNILCEKENHIIHNFGNFQSTSGHINELPEDIVVDYIICYSFEWLVRIIEVFKESYPSFESLGNFIIQNKSNIEEEIIGINVFRKGVLRKLEDDAISKIWERFIHHLCNAYLFPSESLLKQLLKENRINIL